MTDRVYYVRETEIVRPCLFSACALALPNYNSHLGGTVRHLINWLLSAMAVWVVARLYPSQFAVHGITAALIAALVIGLINATLGAFLKIVTLPLTVLTLGIFWLVINALMLELASAILSPAFHVNSFV